MSETVGLPVVPLVLLGGDDAGVCVDGVCAVPGTDQGASPTVD